jgi:tryptophan synthase alpha chain
MSRLDRRFAALRAEKRCGFIPFVVAGDPDLGTTPALLSALSATEPAAIEVGVPFSDPTADGPAIQRASQRALAGGATLAGVLQTLGHRPNERPIPLILFSYYNPILQFGLERFARLAAERGIAGVLVVDLPAEAAAPLATQLRRCQIDLIFLVAPTTSEQRLRRIARLASGFIYAVARPGVTGRASNNSDESKQLVARVRAVTNLPVAVGFGIRTPAHARRVCRYADAAVVGSRLVELIEAASARNLPRARLLRQVRDYAAQFS